MKYNKYKLTYKKINRNKILNKLNACIKDIKGCGSAEEFKILELELFELTKRLTDLDLRAYYGKKIRSCKDIELKSKCERTLNFLLKAEKERDFSEEVPTCSNWRESYAY